MKKQYLMPKVYHVNVFDIKNSLLIGSAVPIDPTVPGDEGGDIGDADARGNFGWDDDNDVWED